MKALPQGEKRNGESHPRIKCYHTNYGIPLCELKAIIILKKVNKKDLK